MSRVGPTGKPTPEDLKSLRYLRAVLNGKSLSFSCQHRQAQTERQYSNQKHFDCIPPYLSIFGACHLKLSIA